jgi:23S rRNA pseudouridine2457 synthase
MSQLILFNKPFRVLSQFTDRERPENARATLSDFIEAPSYRPAGRLDYDSEGLLLLTSDGKLQHQITHPKSAQWKTYWVQVEGQISGEACRELTKGVVLRDGLTRPARASVLAPPDIWERHPPIRVRKTVCDSWLELSITEGKNRQIRRMTAAVGYPTLRLVRVSIGPWHIESLKPGEHRYISLP